MFLIIFYGFCCDKVFLHHHALIYYLSIQSTEAHLMGFVGRSCYSLRTILSQKLVSGLVNLYLMALTLEIFVREAMDFSAMVMSSASLNVVSMFKLFLHLIIKALSLSLSCSLVSDLRLENTSTEDLDRLLINTLFEVTYSLSMNKCMILVWLYGLLPSLVSY